MIGGEIVEQRFEGGRVFARDDDCAGSEAVLEGVAGGNGLARGCARSGRLAGEDANAAMDPLAHGVSLGDEVGAEFFERFGGDAEIEMSWGSG